MAFYWLLQDGDPIADSYVMATARSIDKARAKAIQLLEQYSMAGVKVYRKDSFNHGVVSRMRGAQPFTTYLWTAKDGAKYVLNRNGSLGRRL